jgi:hypothetical protein
VKLHFFLLTLAGLGITSSALATPKIPRSQIVTVEGTPAKHIPPSANQAYTVKDANARLALVATFEQGMQVTAACNDSGPCELGGIREVETGPGASIVESDNTHQAIFIWSYQHSMDAQQSHPQQITNAFDYLTLNPAWLEWMDGGGTGPDYYSLYNCGWAFRAVLAYEAATNDMSHHPYATMCQQHVTMYALNVTKSNDIIDMATAGWSASGLWLWAHANNDATGEQTAVNIGAAIKTWIDAKPARLSFQSWAVTGGSTFDAVINTYMKAHPDELEPWVTQNAPLLGGWIDETGVANPNDWTDWRNALAGWNMLALFDAANSLTGPDADNYRTLALEILDKLWTQDGDNDGAIAGSLQRPGTEDESWITAYFTIFGLRQIYTLPTPMPDAGAMDDGGMTPADGGTQPPKKDGGCSCNTATGGDGGAILFFAAIVAACRFRKMRARSSRERGAASAGR